MKTIDTWKYCDKSHRFVGNIGGVRDEIPRRFSRRPYRVSDPSSEQPHSSFRADSAE